jgi:hypothetical protein
MGRWGNSISIDVDVDLNDVYSEMNTSDRKEMTSWLYKDGHLDEYIKKKNLTSPVNGLKWKDVCDKLANNQLRLTNEEEEIIKK